MQLSPESRSRAVSRYVSAAAGKSGSLASERSSFEMPPFLALSGCVVVVFILLRVERRCETYSSWRLLLPTAWLLIVASRPLGTWFLSASSSASSFEEGSGIDRLVLTALICLALVLLFRRIGGVRLHLLQHFPLFLLYGFLALSILWSDYPFVSLKRWIRLFGAVPIAFLVANEKDPETALVKVVRRIGYVLIPLSLVLIKYYPRLGCGYSRWSGVLMWHGVTLTKNALGHLCLMTILGLVWANVRRLKSADSLIPKDLLVADSFVVLVALYLMIGTPSGAYSATSVAVLAVVIGAMVMLFKFKRSARGLASLLCAGAVAGWLAMTFAQSFLAETSMLLGRDETLTGRTDIWAMALSDASAHPILGSGFGGYFNTDNDFTATFGNTGHNGILDTYVETGVLGVLILVGFLCWGFAAIRKAIGECFQFGVLALTVLLMNLLSNFTESLFLKSSSYLWTMLLLISIMAASAFWRATTGTAAPSVALHPPRRVYPMPISGRYRPHRRRIRGRPDRAG
jgi:O-antigen ligase